MCIAGCFAHFIGDDGLVDAPMSVTGIPNDQIVDIPVWITDTHVSYSLCPPKKIICFCLLLTSSLTLGHLAFLAALDTLAVVVPADGRVGKARHLAFQHHLFAFDHLHVSQRFNKVWHRPPLHFTLQHLGLLGNGWHLLQLGPGGRKDWRVYFISVHWEHECLLVSWQLGFDFKAYKMT